MSHYRRNLMTLKEVIANRIIQLCEERKLTPYSLAMLYMSAIIFPEKKEPNKMRIRTIKKTSRAL